MPFDRRVHAHRPGLAEKSLEGRVDSERFTEGWPATIVKPKVLLRPRPDFAAGPDTELLLGEPVTIFDISDGWAWVKAGIDSYVGYLPTDSIESQSNWAATHWVSVPRTFVYADADMKTLPVECLSMGSRVRVTSFFQNRGTTYAITDRGSVIADHLATVGEPVSDDYVAVASRFLETPYLWAGRSGLGIDCSGLVQLSLMMAGKAAPRDSDQQREQLGTEIDRGELRRGDLVFWKGHVAIMENDTMMIHANGKTMLVSREPLDAAIARIEPLYGPPLVYKRA